MLMICFVLIAFLIYVGMLLHTYICKGDIECLSDVAYDKHRFLFPVIMDFLSFSLFVVMIDKTPDAWQFLCYLAMIGGVGVGCTPYKDKDMYIFHYIFALTTIVSIFLLWVVHGEWWIPFIFSLAGLRKKWLLGIELSMAASAFAYCLI